MGNLGIVASGFRNVSYQAVVLADNPISYWRLGESSGTIATDVMGLHNGTYVSSPTLGVAGAIVNDTNTAVDFTGSQKYVNVAGYTTIPPTTITLEAWINAALFSDMVPAGWYTSQFNCCHLYLVNTDDVSFVCMNDAVPLTIANVAGINTGWHHIAATHDGTSGRLYIDGALVAGPTAMTAPSGTSTYPFKIGNYGNDYGAGFTGKIDEPAVYGTALSVARILAHYNAGR